MMHINLMEVCSKKAKLDVFGFVSSFAFLFSFFIQHGWGGGRQRKDLKIKLQL